MSTVKRKPRFEAPPGDNFSPLSYAELEIIKGVLEKMGTDDALPELIARVDQQLKRSNAVMHSFNALNEQEFASRFYAPGSQCMLCGNAILRVNWRIHIARKHFLDVSFGQERDMPEGVRQRRGGTHWTFPTNLQYILTRSEDFADGWDLDQSQEFYGHVATDGGVLPEPGVPGVRIPVQNGSGGLWTYIEWSAGDLCWRTEGGDYYSHLSVEVEVPV